MTMNRRVLMKMAVLAAGASALPARAQTNSRPGQTVPKSYRRIAVEESFSVPEYFEWRSKYVPTTTIGAPASAFKDIYARLFDLGSGRIAEMDANGIAMQVLSMNAPGVQAMPPADAAVMARLVNDRLAAAIAAHPTRFAGLTTVGPQDPQTAAKEIERGAQKLNMSGVLINSHTNNEFLDDPKFLPIFEALAANDMPLYLHPNGPTAAMEDTLKIPGFTVGWSYGVDAGTHAVRLIAAGIFDRFPTLKLVLGHMGEALPFWISRMDNRFEWEYRMTGKSRPLKRLPSDYIRDNIYVTTSGMNYGPQTRMALDVMGREHVLFAIDYPYEDNREAVAAIDAMPLSDLERSLLCHGNSERVFKLRKT